MGLGRNEENKIAFWDMVYKYNPSIQYSYREPEPGVSSTKWISSVQAKSCEHGMNCDFMYSPDAIIVADNYAVEKMVEAGLCVKYNPDEKTSNNSKPYCMLWNGRWLRRCKRSGSSREKHRCFAGRNCSSKVFTTEIWNAI